jgi:hypothetical protein
VIPKWGATVAVRAADPIPVPAKLSPEELEALRLRVETTMLQLHTGLDAETGYSDSQPLQSPPVPATRRA